MSAVATVTPENIGDMKLYDLSELLPKEESSKSEDLCALLLYLESLLRSRARARATCNLALP